MTKTNFYLPLGILKILVLSAPEMQNNLMTAQYSAKTIIMTKDNNLLQA